MTRTVDDLAEEVSATFGREFTQHIDIAIATVNCGGSEQTREAALSELRNLHLLQLREVVMGWIVNAYLAPQEGGW